MVNVLDLGTSINMIKPELKGGVTKQKVSKEFTPREWIYELCGQEKKKL